jgi:hypothetical protein
MHFSHVQLQFIGIYIQYLFTTPTFYPIRPSYSRKTKKNGAPVPKLHTKPKDSKQRKAEACLSNINTIVFARHKLGTKPTNKERCIKYGKKRRHMQTHTHKQ